MDLVWLKVERKKIMFKLTYVHWNLNYPVYFYVEYKFTKKEYIFILLLLDFNNKIRKKKLLRTIDRLQFSSY